MATPPAHSHSPRWRRPSQGPAVQGGFLPTDLDSHVGRLIGAWCVFLRGTTQCCGHRHHRRRFSNQGRAISPTGPAACVPLASGAIGDPALLFAPSHSRFSSPRHGRSQASGHQTRHDDKPARGLHTVTTANATGGGRTASAAAAWPAAAAVGTAGVPCTRNLHWDDGGRGSSAFVVLFTQLFKPAMCPMPPGCP